VAEGSTDGPPMLLLPGGTFTWEVLGDLISALEQRWHVYACDLRGHGKSGHATSGYRVVDFARDVAALIERSIGQPTVVLGHSLGAMVTLRLPSLLPTLVRAVVALDPPLILRNSGIQSLTDTYAWLMQDRAIRTSSRTLEDIAAQVRRYMPELDEGGVQYHVRRINGLDPAMFDTVLDDRLLDGFDLEPGLRAVACPTLLLYGEPGLGGVVRETDAALFRACVPQAQLIQIKGGGHWFPWGPGSVALEHMTAFLESV
jgi:pimeloyl-ACP methyl ester carboxylesterase